MILVRDIFQLKFGKSRDAMTLWKEGKAILQASGHKPMRIMTDLTGPYYTMVLESEFANLAEFEAGHSSTAMTDEWRKWYSRFTELVDSGRREIFTIVE
jgi:hypothetical protein